MIGEAVEALRCGGEVEPVGGVLGLVPSGTDAQLDAPAAHVVDLGDTDGQLPGTAEGHRRDQGSESDRRCLTGQAGQGDPGIGGPGQTTGPAHDEVVIAAEESGEPEALGALGDGQLRVVRGALLGFGEDAQIVELHPRTVPVADCPGFRRRSTGTRVA